MRDIISDSKVYILIVYSFGLWGFLVSELGMVQWVLVVVTLPVLALLLSISYLKDHERLSIFQIRKPQLSTFLWLVVVAILVIGSQRFVYTRMMEQTNHQQTINDVVWEVASSGRLLLFVLLMVDNCLTSPIFEEVFCRGVLMTHFFKDSKYYLDIVMSSVIFSLAHMNISDFEIVKFIYFLIPGVGLGFLFRKTMSIYPSIVLHCLWNIYASWPYLRLLYTHVELWISFNTN